MAQYVREFSEVSQEYSSIAVEKEQLAKIAQRIANYESKLTQLTDLKSAFENIQSMPTLNAFFSDEQKAGIPAQLASIEAQINSIKAQVQSLRDDDLNKRKDQIDEASKDLDSYIKLANTNPEFKRTVREQIIRDTQARIDELQDEINQPNEYVTFIEKLQSMSATDPNLKQLLDSIDTNKDKISKSALSRVTLESLLTSNQDPRQKDTFQRSIDAIDADISSRKTKLESYSDKLKGYVSDHREDFGLPAGTDALNFDDLTSPLSVVPLYTDPDKNKGLKDLKSEFANRVSVSMDKINELAKLQRFQDYAERDLDNVAEEENQNLFVPFLTKAKVFFKNLWNKFESWGKDKSKPAKIQAPPMGAKVVGSHSDFIKSVHTEIGDDAIKKVVADYEQRYAREQQQQQQQQGQSR